MSITKKTLFKIGGQTVAEYTLKSNNYRVKILNYGGIVSSIKVRTANGFNEVVLGYENPSDYLTDEFYLGVIVGRVCGRIKNAEFGLNGETFHLNKNDGINSLHGGFNGFNKKIFSAKIIGDALFLNAESSDGEGGFPGNLFLTVKYSLTEYGLRINYRATADKDTPINISNHTYFNIADDINEVKVYIDADKITPVDAKLIPFGFMEVSGTPFDFKKLKKIGDGVDADDKLIKICNGYDINYVLNHKRKSLVAKAISDKFVLSVKTNRPCMQFYTGNFLAEKQGKGFKKRSGFCFETQGFPDAVNNPDYPSIVLKKGKVFTAETIYEIVSKI